MTINKRETKPGRVRRSGKTSLNSNHFYTEITHCGESKTQRKLFLDEKRDGLVDENRVNNKGNKNKKAVFTLYPFAYNVKPMP